MAEDSRQGDPVETPLLPSIFVGLEGTDEVPDMIESELPGRPARLHMAEFFPDWWSHPGLDKTLWHPPLVPNLWLPPQKIPAVWHPPMEWREWQIPMIWPPEVKDIVLVTKPRVHCDLFPEWQPPQRYPTHPVKFPVSPAVPEPTGADSPLHDEHQRRLQNLGGLDPLRPADLVQPPAPPPSGMNRAQFSEMIKMGEKCFASYDEYLRFH